MALTLRGQSSTAVFTLDVFFDATVIPATIAEGDVILLASVLASDANTTAWGTLTGTAGAASANATLVSIDNLETLGDLVTVITRTVWQYVVTAAVAAAHNGGAALDFNNPTPTGPTAVQQGHFTGIWMYDTDNASYDVSAANYDVSEPAGTQTEADSIDGTVASGGAVAFLGCGWGPHSGSIATLTGTWTGEDNEEATLTRTTNLGFFYAVRLAESASTGAAESATWTLDTTTGFAGENIVFLGVFSFLIGEAAEEEEVAGIRLSLNKPRFVYAELPYQLHTRML